MGSKSTKSKIDAQVANIDHYPEPIKILVREWHVIKGAPISFVLCLIISGAIIWIVTDRLYSSELRAKDATIQTLSLRPESTTSQMQEIQRLQTEIKVLQSKESYRNATEWEPLSEEQIEIWRKALAPCKIESISLFWTHAEGSQFYASISRVLKDSGCKLTHQSGSSDSNEFSIYASPGDPAGAIFLGLLNEGGYKAELNKEVVDWKQWRKEGRSQIEIFLGAKN